MQISKYRSRILAIGLVFIALLSIMSYPANRLITTYADVLALQNQINALKLKTAKLQQRMPAKRDIASVAVNMSQKDAQSQLINIVKNSVNSLGSTKLVKLDSETFAGNWVLSKVSISGRGDLIDVNTVLKAWAKSEPRLFLYRVKFTAFGQRRGDDDILLEAQIALLSYEKPS